MGTLNGKAGLVRAHEFSEVNHITWCENRPPIQKVIISMTNMTKYSPIHGQFSVKALRKSTVKKCSTDVNTLKEYSKERLILEEGIEA